ncbi:MAG: hypothetical protein IJ860_09290, partial [Eubacterium sp.]|nr:hypothetical protein [Eubacterium sp.]
MSKKTTKAKRRKKGAIIFLLILLVIVAGAFYCAYRYLTKISKYTVYLEGTRLNDLDVSGKTPGDVAALLLDDYANAEFTVTEGRTEVLSGSLADYGYSFDRNALTASLTELQQAEVNNPQMVLTSLLKRENQLHIEYTNAFDEEKLKAYVTGSALSVPRVASKNASFLYDAEKKECYVDAAVQGNEIDDAVLQNAVQEKLDALMTEFDAESGLSVEIPENAYTSPVIEDNTAELQKKADLLNQYTKSKIVYQFGSKKQKLDFDTIMDWLTVDTDKGTVTI